MLIIRIVCGTSAGSFIASVLCTTPFDQLKEKFKENKKINIFLPKGKGLLNYLYMESLYDVSHLKEVYRENIGDHTFQVYIMS